MIPKLELVPLFVTDLPPQCVAVGVPARVIKQQCEREPSLDMDQCSDFLLDYQI